MSKRADGVRRLGGSIETSTATSGRKEPTMTPTGFPPELMTFLRDLSTNNSKAWFEAHRDDYERYYLGPARAFVEAVGPRLAELAPVVAEPRVNGSIFRINRDVRFSKDPTPYKDHLDLWFWQGERRGAVSGFFLRVTAERIVVGAGAHLLDPSRLGRFRRAVVDPRSGAALVDAVRACEAAGHEVGGERYKRVPAGFEPATDDAARLLRFSALWAATDEPHPRGIGGPSVIDYAMRRWCVQAPVHRWLVENLDSP
jgi:uncharacterized protein (TIGR02453 family)